jgi:Heme exporter protein D (CcmD)
MGGLMQKRRVCVAEWWQWFMPWWSDLAAFGRMGKHGLYVWASVGLTALALGLEWRVLCRAGCRRCGQAQTKAVET